MECSSTRIWLGISDFQEEGIFLNVSRYSFQDVFVDSAIVGTNLKETRWGLNQPGGGVIENCVGTHRYFIQGAAAVWAPLPQKFSPHKMTQNGMKCPYE